MAGPAPAALSAWEGSFQLRGEGPLRGAAARWAAVGGPALPGCPPAVASFGSSDRATRFSVRKWEGRGAEITKTLENSEYFRDYFCNLRRRKSSKAQHQRHEERKMDRVVAPVTDFSIL